MPKTISITPSWYWPEGIPRVLGVPPYGLDEMLVRRWARRPPDRPLLAAGAEGIGAGELAERVGAIVQAIEAAIPAGGRVTVKAGASAEGAVVVLGALASGRSARLVPAAGSASWEPASDVPIESATSSGATCLREPAALVPGRTGPVWHSQRSLLAGALALRGFLGAGDGQVWLSTFSPCSWQGLCGLGATLAGGDTVVLAEPGDDAPEADATWTPTWVLTSMPDALASWQRRRRKGDGAGRAVLLFVEGPFDPDERRAAGRAVGGVALSVFGLGETGPVFASHPSWYLDEAVGLPVTNMHVVPGDPDTAEPINTLWELVDEAMVTVWSPSLAVGHEEGSGLRRVGRQVVTGMLAASDPNGMLYLTDERIT